MKVAGKHVLATDAIAEVLFILVGITFIILALTGRITMGVAQPLEQMLGTSVANIVRSLRSLPGSEALFAIVIIVIIGYIIKKGRTS